VETVLSPNVVLTARQWCNDRQDPETPNVSQRPPSRSSIHALDDACRTPSFQSPRVKETVGSFSTSATLGT